MGYENVGKDLWRDTCLPVCTTVYSWASEIIVKKRKKNTKKNVTKILLISNKYSQKPTKIN